MIRFFTYAKINNLVLWSQSLPNLAFPGYGSGMSIGLRRGADCRVKPIPADSGILSICSLSAGKKTVLQPVLRSVSSGPFLHHWAGASRVEII